MHVYIIHNIPPRYIYIYIYIPGTQLTGYKGTGWEVNRDQFSIRTVKAYRTAKPPKRGLRGGVLSSYLHRSVVI